MIQCSDLVSHFQKNALITTMNKFVEMLATFFYVGKIPFAPGTFGTLAAIPLWFALSKLNQFGIWRSHF